MSIDLRLGDCLELLPQMEAESVDLVATDCPYKICRCGGMSKCGGIFSDRNPNIKTGKLFDNNSITFDKWLPEIYRVLKNKTHCYIMVSGRHVAELQKQAEKVGFIWQQLLVWDKGNAVVNAYYMNTYELILMLRKGGAKYINNTGTKNIISVANKMGNRLHPTEKPVQLMKILIENSTQENDIVLDPFMGAGSTGLACKELNRNFIGMEIDEKYFNIAQNRILDKNIQLKLF